MRDLLVLWLATLGANLLLSPKQPGWVGLAPHPYLIPIALMAARHGAGRGLLLAGLLLATYQLWGHTGNPLESPHNQVFASALLTATVVGSLLDQYRRRQAQLEHELAQKCQELTQTLDQKQVLESAVAELRARILGSGQTFGSLYGLARQLTTLSPEQLYRSCLELACKQTEANHAHFYLVQGGELLPVAHHPPETAPAQPGTLVRQAVESRKLCSAADCRSSEKKPLIAVPLVGEDGTVHGVLSFDDLPFRRFHPTTLGELESIADWTARAMRQVSRYQDHEHRLAEGHQAQLQLLEKLRHIPLQPRDLPLMQAIAEPMLELLLDTLCNSLWCPLLRSNLFLILERIPLSPQQQQKLQQFVSQELAWVRQAHHDLFGLSHQGEEEALQLLVCYLRHILSIRRRHVLQAQALLRPLQKDLMEQLVALPVAQPQADLHPNLRKTLEMWAGSAVTDTLAASVMLGSKAPGHITLEEQILDFLGRPDLHLVCASLHCLISLCGSGQRATWTDLDSGTPASLALELSRHAEPRIREAALRCLLDLPLKKAVIADAQRRVAIDPDPRVRRLARS